MGASPAVLVPAPEELLLGTAYVMPSPASHRVLPLGPRCAAGYGQDLDGPLFRPVKNNTTKQLRKTISPRSVLRDVVQHYAQAIGLAQEVQGLCTHSLRATGATNALDHGADIAEVQVWLGHADISTTRLYDHRRRRPEESPTFRVRY